MASILIIDDEANIRALLRTVLEAAGYARQSEVASLRQ